MIDVYSCNFGPRDDGRHLDGPGPETGEAAIERKGSLEVEILDRLGEG